MTFLLGITSAFQSNQASTERAIKKTAVSMSVKRLNDAEGSTHYFLPSDSKKEIITMKVLPKNEVEEQYLNEEFKE